MHWSEEITLNFFNSETVRIQTVCLVSGTPYVSYQADGLYTGRLSVLADLGSFLYTYYVQVKS